MEVQRSQPPPTASSTHPHSRMNSTGGQPALMSHQSFQSQYSSYSHSSRDTQGTNATTASTLFGQPPPAFPSLASTPVNGGPVEASDSVLNKRADKDTSLFQHCLTLQLRLRAVSGVERWLLEEEDRADEDEPVDPVTLLWRTFRRGYPLMELYNALGPPNPLVIPNAKADEKSQKKHEKMATYKFIQACVNELGISQESCFILMDLYGDDTTGFVKVCYATVHRESSIMLILAGHQRRQQSPRLARQDGQDQPCRRRPRRPCHLGQALPARIHH